MAVIFHYCTMNKGNKENKRKCGFANLGLHVPVYIQDISRRGEFIAIIYCGYTNLGECLKIYHVFKLIKTHSLGKSLPPTCCPTISVVGLKWKLFERHEMQSSFPNFYPTKHKWSPHFFSPFDLLSVVARFLNSS